MDTHKLTILRLQTIPGIGQKTLGQILNWANGSEEQLSGLFSLESHELKRMFRLKDNTIAALRDAAIEDIEPLAEALYRRGFQLLIRSDDEFPSQILENLDEKAPPLLYVFGDIGKLAMPGIAFSGSRRVSEQGIAHTIELVQGTVQQGYTIISGHAPGVDAIAHRTALENGGVTVLVLPEGAMKFRLRAELRDLYQQNPENLLVVSEFSPQMGWSVGNAMSRNRTIIGLSETLCIIEAGATGGTLNAGLEALKFGLPACVLDYPQPPKSAEGNAILLTKGAHPIGVSPRAMLPDLQDIYSSKPAQEKPSQLPLF